MANNPTSFRLPIRLPANIHPDLAEALQVHDDAINDLQQAIPHLKGQVGTSTSSSSSTTNTNSSSQNVTIAASNVIGFVNNQTGFTSYATQPSDYGAYIILSDASPIAVTLTTGTVITLPWFATFINLNTGVATLTPASGTINGAGSFSLGTNGVCTISYDGVNFFADPEVPGPQNTPSVTHEWFNAYNASTGIFTQTQPAFTDISGIAIVSQGGTGTATPSLVSGTNISVTGSFPNQTVSTAGYTGTITTAKLTVSGTNGSMTFSAGVLTAQVAAT